MKICIYFLAVYLLFAGTATPADTTSHGHDKHMSLEMKQQHHNMSVINKQWNIVKKALQKGDLKSAGSAMEKIHGASSQIEKFMVHRNADKHDQFIEEYRSFLANIKKLRDDINKKDDTNINNSMNAVQENCNHCHVMFR